MRRLRRVAAKPGQPGPTTILGMLEAGKTWIAENDLEPAGESVQPWAPQTALMGQRTRAIETIGIFCHGEPRVGLQVLREPLDELGMSANALAGELHVPTNRITGILNGTRALTPETALRLERFFRGTTAQFWLNLQTGYELRKAEIASGPELRKIRPWRVA